MIEIHLAARENGTWSKTKFAPAPIISGQIEYGRPTLGLVHGYGAMDGARKAYDHIAWLFPGLQIIGVYWPSSGGFGSQLGSYLRADARTDEAADMLSAVLRPFDAPVVLQGHSLGCDVLYDYSRLQPHHRLILTAAAVPNNRPYHCHRRPVAYISARDAVLRWAFRAASLLLYRGAPALGVAGPAEECRGCFTTRDCTAHVDSHGGYHYSPWWRAQFQSAVNKELQ